MPIVRLTQFDEDSLALILPDEMLARAKWKVGDTVLLTESADGFLLSKPHATFRQLAESDIRDPD